VPSMNDLIGSIRRSVLFMAFVLTPWQVGAQPFFKDVTERTIGSLPFTPVGLAFGDYDNDGHTDLLMGPFGGIGELPRFALLGNDGRGRLLERGNAAQEVDL